MSLDAHLVVRLDRLALDLPVAASPGTVVAVLGPNGAGKTTALRALAGLRRLDGGHVTLAGRDLDRPATGTFVPPERRRVAWVPQDHLLFPHLSVLENVAFGPRSGGVPRAEARARARSELEAVGLAEVAGVRPRALSGGQAQRVALARALAGAPDLVLLDEPLAALDATTRATTRRDLGRRLAGVPAATVLVTHDPLDALVLAQHLVVVEDGGVVQAGPVTEVTARPRTRYVADLVGTNLLRGRADGTTVRVGDAAVTVPEPRTGEVFLTIPPSALALHPERPTGSARNAWPCTVAAVDMLGERVRVELAGPLPLTAEITPAALVALGLQVGDPVWAAAKATEVDAYPI